MLRRGIFPVRDWLIRAKLGAFEPADWFCNDHSFCHGPTRRQNPETSSKRAAAPDQPLFGAAYFLCAYKFLNSPRLPLPQERMRVRSHTRTPISPSKRIVRA